MMQLLVDTTSCAAAMLALWLMHFAAPPLAGRIPALSALPTFLSGPWLPVLPVRATSAFPLKPRQATRRRSVGYVPVFPPPSHGAGYLRSGDDAGLFLRAAAPSFARGGRRLNVAEQVRTSLDDTAAGHPDEVRKPHFSAVSGAPHSVFVSLRQATDRNSE